MQVWNPIGRHIAADDDLCAVFVQLAENLRQLFLKFVAVDDFLNVIEDENIAGTVF